MALQIAYGGIRSGKSPTLRRFYCPTHGRVEHGDEEVRPALLTCANCLSFLDPKPRIGTRQRIREVAEKWRLNP